MEDWINKKTNLIWNQKHNVAKCSIFKVALQPLAIFNSDTESSSSQISDNQVESTAFKKSICALCSIDFDDVTEQRNHFKSDLHVANLKRKMHNLPRFSAQEYESSTLGTKDQTTNSNTNPTIFGDVDSSEEDDELIVERDDSSLQRSTANSVYGTTVKSYSNRLGHQLIHRPACEKNWEVIFNISVIPPPEGTAHFDPLYYIQELKRFNQIPSAQTWAYVVLRSGRFAGAIFQQDTQLVHKVFRRYTVRAKAGGSQSAHDNQAGRAQSMGAQLRRNGEKMLREEVQALLLSWSSQLELCHKILLSVPKTMQSVLFEYSRLNPTQSAPLVKGDPRIVHLPFTVAKPTYEEIRAAHEKCTTVLFRQIVVPLTSDALLSKGSSSVLDTVHEEDAVDVDRITELEIEAASLSNTSLRLRSVPSTDGVSADHENDLTVDHMSLNGAPINAEEEDDTVLLPEYPLSKQLFRYCIEGDTVQVRRILECLAQNSEQRGHHYDDRDDVNDASDDEETEGEPLRDESKDVEDPQLTKVDTIDYTELASDWDLYSVLHYPQSLTDLKTPLHVAAEYGHHRIVQLLIDYGANPCKVDIRNRTAYYLAKDKRTRDTFRRGRGRHESEWNWEAAGVPAALTEELERQQRDKEKEKKKRLKQKKKVEKERNEQEKQDKLYAMELQRQEEEAEKAALTQRLSAPCDNCGKILLGVQALLFLNKRCCSTACTLALRRKLTVEAAMARLQGGK